MNLNMARSRVVDPVLSTHVRGYRQASLVGHLLFPTVEVDVAAGKVIEFGKEDFMLYNARRAAGAATKRIEFGYEGKPFALCRTALKARCRVNMPARRRRFPASISACEQPARL